MGLAEAVCNAILDHYFGGEALSPPATVYAALADSGGSEPAGGGYARVAVASSGWDPGSGREIVNTAAITFPAPTGDWGTITQAKLFDAATAGTELGAGDLTEPVEVLSGGTTPEFIAGSVHIKFTT